MIQQQAIATTTEASRILQRLCYHFGRKVEASWDAQQGVVRFPWGTCEMRATAATLTLVCIGLDEAALASARQVIDGHMALFTRKNPMHLHWSPLEAATAA